MSEHSQPPNPPTPRQAAQDALRQGAKDVAKQEMYRKVYEFARNTLPAPVYRLLFRGMSAAEIAEDALKKRVNSMLWGGGIFLVFLMVVSAVLLVVTVIVVLSMR